MARRGFSLLEVMIAIAILGMSLTVILSQQGGLAASNRSAANMAQASMLGRCKMTELEEKQLKFGFPLIDEIDQGVSCCENADQEGFKCDTRVEKVELPTFQSGNSLGDGGALIGPSASASSPLGALTANPAGGPGLNLSGDGGLQNMGNQIAQQFGGGAGVDGLLSMVMGILYPSMKPMYEASIRRATVTVKWREGRADREFALVQYVTSPQNAGFAGNALLPDGGVMDFSSNAAGSSTNTGSTTGGNSLGSGVNQVSPIGGGR